MKCLPVWNRCNNRCVMCSNPLDYARFGKYDLANLKKRLARIPVTETEIYLTGGEPSMHPEFGELLRAARRALPRARILIDTNGRMFSYPALAGACAGLGNIEFQVSLCGHDAPSHDGITRTPGSFKQALAGIRNLLTLRGAGVEVEIRFVLTRLSLRNMEKVYRRVSRLPGVKALVFIFMEMEGHAGANLKATGLTYAQARPELVKFFRKLRAGKLPAANFDLKLYHFPLCTLPAALWPRAWRTLPGKEIAFPAACRRCGVRKLCLGVHRDYLKRIGAGEFAPPAALPPMKLSTNTCRPILSVEGAEL